MISFKHRQNLTKWTLLLVWWVVGVCLANNIGFIQSCLLEYSEDGAVAQTLMQATDSGEETASKCELSEHLINLDQHHIADQAVLVYTIALALILWLLSTTPYFPPFTEPILHKGRRVHLNICVFRE